MAYCLKCGAELAPEASFCGQCGAPINPTNVSFSNEPDFDESYFEGVRQRNLEDAQSSATKGKTFFVLGPVICCLGYFLWQQEGFGMACLSFLAWFMGIVLFYTAIITYSYSSKQVKKYQGMTAHDLYIEKKRNSQMWQNIANGAKIANTGLNFLRLFS